MMFIIHKYLKRKILRIAHFLRQTWGNYRKKKNNNSHIHFYLVTKDEVGSKPTNQTDT